MTEQEIKTLHDSARARTFLNSHPLSIALTVTVVLFLLGSTILAHRSGTTVPQDAQTWTDTTVTLMDPAPFTPVYTQTPGTQITPAQATDTRPLYTYAPAAPASSPQKQADSGFNTFLTQLLNASRSSSATSTVSASTDADIRNVYSYIPQGLISTSTTRKRTTEQEALFRYGNAAGAVIKTFEAGHPDEMRVVSDQAADRTSASKAQALRSLGNALARVGTDLSLIQEVPETARAAHDQLAQSYIDIGKKLSLVADAQGDKAFLDAITTYNTAADGFTRNFIGLATVFSVSGVSFSPGDTGSTFSFSGFGSF